MDDELALEEITDLIASIEMHRQEIEKEAGAEAARNYALPRLRQALLDEQKSSQAHGATDGRLAMSDALTAAIGRVEVLGRKATGYPPADRGPGAQPRRFGRDSQRGPGRKAAGRRPGRWPTS